MAHELHREDSKNGDVMEDAGHKICAMLEKWATLDAFVMHQGEVNTNTANILSKLTHYVYEDGLNTKLALNKQTASSDTETVAAGLKRLWWAVGVTSSAIVSLLGVILAILLKN